MPEQDTFQMKCPACGAEYMLTREYIGQKAECSECKASFVIEEPAPQKTASAPQPLAGNGGNTSTTKIPRMSGTVSMIPRIDDPFELGIVQSPGPGQKSKSAQEEEQQDADSAKKKGHWKFWK